MNTENSVPAVPRSEAEAFVSSEEAVGQKNALTPSYAPVIGVVAMMAVALPLVFSLRSNPQAAQPSARGDSPASATAILWNSNFEFSQQIATASKKMIMILFVRDSCSACELMEKEVFARAPIIVEAQLFVTLKIDAMVQSQIAVRYRVEECPTIVWTDALGNEKQRANGALNGFELYQAMQQFH